MRTRVVLAFVSHQPLGERRLRRGTLDPRITRGILPHPPPRSSEAVNPVRAMLGLAESLGAPVTLAISNERAHGLRRQLPSTFAALMRGYADGRVRPLYLPAHHTDAALLASDELADEVRLNQECVHSLFGAPPPLRRGLMLPGCAVEPAALAPLEEAGIDFMLCPPLDLELLSASGQAPPLGRPFRLGERLIGLAHVAMPPPRGVFEDDVARYADALAGGLVDGAATVLVGDLEALGVSGVERLQAALARLCAAHELALVGCDELLDAVTPAWLPQIGLAHLQLSPREAHAGTYLAPLLGWLVDAFGLERAPRVAAEVLFAEDYRLDRLPARVRLPLLLRSAMRAERGVRPYLDGYALCDVLHTELRLPGVRLRPRGELPTYALVGLADCCEATLEPRLVQLAAALERTAERGGEVRAARVELGQARAERRRADRELAAIEVANAALQQNSGLGAAARWRELVVRLREHLGAVVIASDHLQRADLLLVDACRALADRAPARTPAAAHVRH